MQVTARELKLRLGQYLDAVRRGETVRVTLRGAPIAEIRPLAPTSHDRLAELIAQGLVTPGNGGTLPPITPAPAKYSATAIVLADRDAEDNPEALDRVFADIHRLDRLDRSDHGRA